MKLLACIFSLLYSILLSPQPREDDQKRDRDFYSAASKWFAAWKLVSKDIYKIDQVKPVEFVFFDDKYVYSSSQVTIKNGVPIKGPDLMNLSLSWRKELHHDSLVLPDRSVLPVGLMSFSADIPGIANSSFFVMPLPSFWESNGVTSKELGLDNVVTGVFIHEFSHSQQMQNFGKEMTRLEKQYNYGVEFSDDIVQNIFSKDSTYKELYRKEVQAFYGSVNGKAIDTRLVKDGLGVMAHRQSQYFKDQFSGLREIDDFFLTMEGLGQYSMYLWLTDPQGGNLEKDLVIQGVRRGGKWWSQEEGFALFLVLGRLKAPDAWARDMFGDKIDSVIDLINEYQKL